MAVRFVLLAFPLALASQKLERPARDAAVRVRRDGRVAARRDVFAAWAYLLQNVVPPAFEMKMAFPAIKSIAK